MTHLPIGKQLSFLETAFLVEDSYLFPVNVDVNQFQNVIHFTLLILPVISSMLALCNAITLIKFLANSKTEFHHVRSYRTSEYLVAYCVLKSMLSALIWVTALPRFLHFGSQLPSTRHSYTNLSKLDTGRTFAIQLPAIFVTQQTLRLVSIWFLVFVLARQLHCLGRALKSPASILDKSLRTSRCAHGLCQLLSANKTATREENCVTCSPIYSSLPCCFLCRLMNNSNKTQRQMFAENWLTPSQVDETVEKAFFEQQPVEADRPRHQRSTFKQFCPVLGATATLLILSATLHIPQIWNYKIQLWERVKDGTVVWRVSNHIGGSHYEYALSVFGLLLPGIACLILLILFSYKIVQLDWAIRREWCISKIPVMFERIVIRAYSWLMWDSKFLIIVCLISFVSWLPLSTIDMTHRLSWVVREREAQEWPDLVTWTVSEITLLVGDFLTQLVLIVMVICESFCMKHGNQAVGANSHQPQSAVFATNVSEHYLHEVDSEFAESSQRSANLGQHDSGISSSTPYGGGVGGGSRVNENMEASFKMPPYCSSPPNQNRNAFISANISAVYGSETCSSFCPGSNSEEVRGLHPHSSPPPLPSPAYTYGYLTPLGRLPGERLRNLPVDSAGEPTAKRACFLHDSNTAALQTREEKPTDFIDPGGGDADARSDDDEASRYFDQQGVLVSKL